MTSSEHYLKWTNNRQLFCAKKEIIAPGYYSRKYGIYISADSEQLFLVQNRSTIPSEDNDLMY